jgi:hypothetical protein
MTPLELFKAQLPHMDMTEESIRQLLGVMLRTGAVCKDDRHRYFLRAGLSPEQIKNFDQNELLKDLIKTSDLHRHKRGALPGARKWAAKELVRYEHADEVTKEKLRKQFNISL